MEIVGLGNCQVFAITSAMREMYPYTTVRYFPNTHRVGEVSIPAFLAAAETADFVLTQPIMNQANPLALSRLRRLVPEHRLVVMPYAYLDGLFSLCFAQQGGKQGGAKVLGGEAIEQELRHHPLEEVLRRFQAGEIDFRQRQRLAATMAELKQRESHCTVAISPIIERHWQRTVVMRTHNHPSVPVLQGLLRQIAGQMGLPLPDPASWTDRTRRLLRLPVACTVVTPRDAEIHGFTYAIPPRWREQGETLIRMVASGRLERSPLAA